MPVHQRLGPKVTEHPAPRRRPRRFSSPNADGWREVLPRRTGDNSVDARRHPARQPPPPPRRPLPAELSGRCLNCLSYKHRRAVCKLPTRCLRCLGFRHLARDCKRPRSPRTSNSVARGQDGPSPAVAARTGGKRRRRRFEMPGVDKGQHLGPLTVILSRGHDCWGPTRYSPCGLATHPTVMTLRMTRCWRSSLLLSGAWVLLWHLLGSRMSHRQRWPTSVAFLEGSRCHPSTSTRCCRRHRRTPPCGLRTRLRAHLCRSTRTAAQPRGMMRAVRLASVLPNPR